MSRDLRIVKVRGGVIVNAAGHPISVSDATWIAAANGYLARSLDGFVKEHEGQTLQLDDKLRITSRQCRCGHPNTMHAGGSGPCCAHTVEGDYRIGHRTKSCDCLEYREALP